MNAYLRATPAFLLGVLIDITQTAFTGFVSAVAANSGTIGGAAAGCIVGSKVAGTTGCAVGSLLFGFVGTYLNPVAGPALIPIAVMLAVVVSFAISLSFGTMLVIFLVYMKMFYPGQVMLTYLAEFVPIFPGWSTLAFRAAYRTHKEARKHHLHAKTA